MFKSVYIREEYKFIHLFFFTFLLVVFSLGQSLAQEKVCIPGVWKGEVVKGIIYLENGDSLEGKFTHLTPYNDIKTTHIEYKGKKKDKANIYRKDIKSYYDEKTDVYRLRVYVDKDSVFVKKGCFFDQGKFLKVLVNGAYTLVEDELNYYSSLEAYSQTHSGAIYYLVKPDGKLLKIMMNDSKYQLLSCMNDKQKAQFEIPNGEFTETDILRAVEVLNTY